MKVHKLHNQFHELQMEEGSTFKNRSDQELWQTFKNGDNGAFIYIYRNYINPLFNIGIQYTRDEGMVKDCLQDFFIELRDRKDHLGNTDNIKLYLFKSFRRRIVHYIQKQNRFVFRDPFKEAFEIEFAVDEKIINAQFSEDQLKSLAKAVDKLSIREREIIYLYFNENLGYQEIAEVLNYSHVSSARRTIYKVLKKLRGYMPLLILMGFIHH